MKLDLYNILNYFYEVTIHSERQFREKIELYRENIIKISLKFFIFPNQQSTNHWIERLTSYIMKIAEFEQITKKKYLKRGEYRDILFDQLSESSRNKTKNAKDTSLYNFHLSGIFDSLKYQKYYTKYRNDFTFDDYNYIRNNIYNFLDEIDELLTNKNKIILRETIHKLINKYLIQN